MFNKDNYDIYGRVILYICVRRHNPKYREIESAGACVWCSAMQVVTVCAVRAIVWYMDQLWDKTVRTEHKQFCVLMNMYDLGMRNGDVPCLLACSVPLTLSTHDCQWTLQS